MAAFMNSLPARLLAAPLLLCLALGATPAQATADEAIAFVETVSEKAIAIISDKAASTEEREAAFRTLLNENADMDRIAAFALGQYRRTPDEAQRAEYRELVENFIVKVYVTRLTDYNDEKLTILGARERGEEQAIVQSEIRFTNGREPVSVDWWLVKMDGGYKIFDVNVVGVWLAQEQRSAFVSVIRNNGGNFDALLKHLRTQIGRVEAGEDIGLTASN
ncbi:MAG: ABC transporter substrate-binding protein [Alphaproteobacteria bacterium]|nr:ABC transporter substrate-binding protein [Alphaproteobacteria bacterium]MDX5417516.1 ABC transporter substrate-binding protein [Alphaproteobacteria bacterium]MDX5494998.1 ABC transporter substrate-binding protein [Alphaproteobacteria bacterium]